MCDITRDNFVTFLSQIQQDIEQSSFIAIDTEFTSLVTSDSNEPSLFDNGEERYQKLKSSVTGIVPLQIGLAIFHKHATENRYIAKTYNFAICPRSYGPIDLRFLCQASSIEFLCNYNFDYSKAFYGGISFMNESQESVLFRYLEARRHHAGLDRKIDEKLMQTFCSEVAEWLVKAKEKEIMPLFLPQKNYDVSDACVQAEIIERFSNVWAFKENGQLMVQKLSLEERVEVSEEYFRNKSTGIMEDMLGFTLVFRKIVEAQKPLIGHNNLMDLMIFYDKFYKPLPDTLIVFKKNLMQLFPVMFDTKHLMFLMKRTFSDAGYFDVSSLSDAYQIQKTEKFIYHILCAPAIRHAENFTQYENIHCPHEAGYDAYMCGYIFVRMAHFFTLSDYSSAQAQPQSFSSYLRKLRPYRNSVNVIRGNIDHLKMDGCDPISRRPSLLYIKIMSNKIHFDSSQLAMLFAPYGSVDVKMYGKKSALLAVSGWNSAHKILQVFKDNKEIYVCPYHFLKHSPIVRNLLCWWFMCLDFMVWTQIFKVIVTNL